MCLFTWQRTMKSLLLVFLFAPGLIACEAMLKVGGDLEWPPYAYIQHMEVQGEDVQLARTVFDKANYCLTFIDMPSVDRGIEELHEGDLDVLMAASFNEARGKKAWFSSPYRQETVILFSHTQSQITGKTIQDLFQRGASFAVNSGSFAGDAFGILQREYAQQIIYLSSTAQRLLMLNSARIDFVVEDQFAGLHIAKENQLLNIKATEHIVYQDPIHFMLSRKRFDQQRVSQINRIIEALQ